MDQFPFDPAVAEAIIHRRILRASPRDVAVTAGFIALNDEEGWKRIEPSWQWHDAMTTRELERRLDRSDD